MIYNDFTLETTIKTFQLNLQQANLFENTEPTNIPNWLNDMLQRGRQLALLSEKARSEFIIAPILLAVRDQNAQHFALYSGQRMDIDASRGLSGKCDFIFARTPAFPVLQSPIVTIVEAKKQDIEAGLGQCAAQIVGAQLFNQQNDSLMDTIFGCVTTGETWQFLKLEQHTLTIDTERYYIVNTERILGVFQSIIHFFTEPQT